MPSCEIIFQFLSYVTLYVVFKLVSHNFIYKTNLFRTPLNLFQKYVPDPHILWIPVQSEEIERNVVEPFPIKTLTIIPAIHVEKEDFEISDMSHSERPICMEYIVQDCINRGIISLVYFLVGFVFLFVVFLDFSEINIFSL